MAESPRVREELWHEKELKRADPGRHFGVTHAAALSHSSQWGQFACKPLKVSGSQQRGGAEGSGRIRAPISDEEERRRVLHAILAAAGNHRAGTARGEESADESMGVPPDNQALLDDDEEKEEAVAMAKRREAEQQESVSQLLGVFAR